MLKAEHFSLAPALRFWRGALAIGAASCLVAMGGALSPATAAETGGAQVDAAIAALRGITTMRADFVQTDQRGSRVSGVMTLKRPGRIRFQYEKSVPLLIVSDGKALTLIDYGVRQVQRWPIRNSPLGALLDPNRDVASYARQVNLAISGAISIEVRDPKHPEYGMITMIFVKNPAAPGGLELASWVALDSQNKRTTVKLSNQHYGLDVPDATFRWRDPRNQGPRK